MRTLTLCLAVLLALSLAAAAAFAADEPSAAAATTPSAAPAVVEATPGAPPAVVQITPGAPPAVVEAIPSTVSSMGEANGSHFDLNLYLNIPELFQMLAKVGAIPPELAERALAASKAEATTGDASTSYVKVEAHIRIAEVAPLLAALRGARSRRVPATEAPPAARLEKPEKRSAAPPAK